MKQLGRTSPQLQAFLAAPTLQHSSAPAVTGFWGPGVRFMGSLQFGAKALAICLMFLIPMAWMGWTYYSTVQANIAFSAKERVGLEYNREVFPVIDLAQQLRRDATSVAAGGTAATLGEVKSKLQAAQARLASVEKRLGAELGSAKAYAAVQQAMSATESATGVDGVFKAHSDHISALIGLLVQVTDGSNLTLDPDIDSYYVMDAAFFRVPDIVEGSGKLRGLGLAVMKVGDATPEQMRVFQDVIPVAEFQVNNMRDGLSKAVAYNPTVGTALNANAAIDATAAFFSLARKSVVNGKDNSPETQAAYLAGANAAIEAQYAFAAKALDQLDGLISVRIAAMRSQRNTVSVVMIVGILLAAYAFYSFFLVTQQGLHVISRHLGEISQGDLRTPPGNPQGNDEFTRAILDVQVAYDALYALIRKVRHGARTLHASSEEIANASGNLQSRTEAAAASLEEQASAMEEIGSTVGATAERVTKAASFAVDNMRVAEKGGQVFAAVTSTMRDIQASSHKISDIIGVIDGIAFQTNILALNAAVEAARAGESGRGFAVVASEVRSLAGRSAEAAREIKSLISASVEKIEHGTSLVDAAGLTMAEVVTNASQINDFLGEISSATKEQALGVAEVGRAIQVLDKSTQENAALVEETTSASDALRQQATTLQEEIANFRVA